MWVGEALGLTLAVFGLAALAETFHWAFVVVKYCGVAYLLWLAWRMWRAPVAVNADGRKPAGSAVPIFFAGIAVTLGNPKIMLFYLALLPALVDLEAVSSIGWLELTATMLVVLAAVDLGYIWLAARARRLFRSPRAMRLANPTCAGIMGAAAGAIASR
jgi:threonine/homoserine/homoserine lactone efflux protein